VTKNPCSNIKDIYLPFTKLNQSNI